MVTKRKYGMEGISRPSRSVTTSLDNGPWGSSFPVAAEDIAEIRAFLEARADDAEVVVGRRGVDHDHHLFLGQPEDDQVVDDPTLFVEEKAVAGAPLRNGGDGEGEDVFETARVDVAPVEELAHVAHVEEGGLFPAPAMFGENPPLILDRHVPATEGGQEGLLFPMSANEGCFPEQLHELTSLGGYRVPQFTRSAHRCKSNPLPSCGSVPGILPDRKLPETTCV